MQKYKKLQVLGEGTFGTVFKAAERGGRKRVVAIKQWKGVEDQGSKREIELLQMLQHPHIVNLISLFREAGKLNLVFE